MGQGNGPGNRCRRPALWPVDWWQSEANEIQKGFIKDLAAAGYGPAIELVKLAMR
jgi:hypothetical protein